MAKFIVTGGGGFVGRALCRRLVEMGHEVISVSRSNYPELENLGAGCAVADLGRDLNVLKRVFQGAKAVFHTAAKVDMWGPYQDFYASNVLGTRNVLQACREAGVPNLIFTSSPSVIACGGDLEGVNESVPYPAKHQAAYPATKAIAEREVLAAN
ncbi:MAG: 3-beta hydroxysteroid dehydrogenase, partial [Proteobacteria bacterium]